jgi:hypothetical protein
MYIVTASDRPQEIQTAPPSSVGAPCPTFFAEENRLVLAYYVESRRLLESWVAVPITPEIAGDSNDLCAVVQFKTPYAHVFGPPNDEAFAGHPLAARGLSPYAIFEIEGSSWLKDLVRMNSVHPHHSGDDFAKYKHFVFAFHDTTLECIAESFSVSLARGSTRSVLRAALNEA